MPPTRWDMGGLHCIVTGGSKGLGRACVEEFLDLGAFVLFTARGADELARVATELRGQYCDDRERVHTLAADVSTAAGRDARSKVTLKRVQGVKEHGTLHGAAPRGVLGEET